jgi:chromosome segregation ATPase
MRRRIALALMPLLLTGCLTPFTSRLDQANQRAADVLEQLIIANSKLSEAAASLERSEKKLDEASATLRRMELRLDEMDRRTEVIEKGFRKMLGIKGPEEGK